MNRKMTGFVEGVEVSMVKWMELYDFFWVEKNMRDHGEVGEVKMGLKKGVQLCAGKNTMESSELTCFEL